MRIAVVGSGYVGLVSGTCLAECGHDVVCIDRDAGRIARLQRGEVPIFEPGLADLVARNVAAGRLRFTTEHADAVTGSRVVFVAVGTPSRNGDGDADLTFVETAVRSIALAVNGPTIVVIKSTVPMGTGDAMQRLVRETRPDVDIAVVSNPEFLREGAAIEDFMKPERIVIGLDDDRARSLMTDVYRPLEGPRTPLLFLSRRSAELAKYAANAFLAIKVSFINEIANLCEAATANVDDVAHAVGLDSRIGARYLNAGPGYGGSCLPKDTRALVRTAREFGSRLLLVEAAMAVNDARRRAMAEKIVSACGGSVSGKTVGLLGLTFKPGTDDMREAPSVTIIQELQARGARIRAFDPEGMTAAAAVTRDVAFAADPYDVATGADAVVIVTEWEAFNALDLGRLRSAMRAPVLVDLRNTYRVEDARVAGFVYSSIGRPDATMAAS